MGEGIYGEGKDMTQQAWRYKVEDLEALMAARYEAARDIVDRDCKSATEELSEEQAALIADIRRRAKDGYVVWNVTAQELVILNVRKQRLSGL